MVSKTLIQGHNMAYTYYAALEELSRWQLEAFQPCWVHLAAWTASISTSRKLLLPLKLERHLFDTGGDIDQAPNAVPEQVTFFIQQPKVRKLLFYMCSH